MIPPIPPLIEDDSDISFRLYPVELSRPESREPLVLVEDYGLPSENYYARTDRLNPPYYEPLEGAMKRVWLRTGIVERLVRVNKAVSAHGVELFLLDGYRSYQCQRAIYQWFYRVAHETMPGATDDEIRRHIGQYISDPGALDLNDSRTWYSHSTGAAVDLTLREIRTKQMLYMGGIFDDPSEVSHTCYYERTQTVNSASDAEARRNRRLLFWAMHSEGFASLPTEWWHYNYGDQLWSKNRRILQADLPREPAWYGAMPSPE